MVVGQHWPKAVAVGAAVVVRGAGGGGAAVAGDVARTPLRGVTPRGGRTYA